MPAGTALAPYEALASVYDRWTEGDHYARWADFVVDRLPADAARVLDLCCGTGTMSALLSERGYCVTGVDRSPQMLAQARDRLGATVPLIRADVRELRVAEPFDAAVCTFDSVNYLVGNGDLAAALRCAAAALRPGGVLVFDLNTRHKLEAVFGDSHHGDDLGDFAYVWRNQYDVTTRTVTFLITLFRRRADGAFTRDEERHEQRWFDHSEITAAARDAGLAVDAVVDDYGDRPPTDATLREAWVLRRS